MIDLLPGNLPSEMSEENVPKDAGSLRERMLKEPDSSLESENFKDQVFFMIFYEKLQSHFSLEIGEK